MDARLIITGARIALGPNRTERRDVHIRGTRANLDLTGHLLLPGLINAHDHLEFNLFPQLGNGPYRNATDWADDIYHPDSSPIRDHLSVPKPVRLWWGALKNLLSGVTTVCHHNAYDPDVFGPDFPVRVVRRFSWAHSLAFSLDLRARFSKTPPSYPFLVHCGEGIDESAREELETLDSLGALDHRTAIVHGVALTRAGLDLMRRRRSSLIWCPTSNLTILGRTVSRAILRSGIPIALATDSALTAPVDLLDELAAARKYLPAARLYEMVTTEPARILRIQHRTATDLIAVRSKWQAPARAIFDATIALVITAGRIRLIAPDLAAQLPPDTRSRFQRLTIENRPTVLVDANITSLRRAAMIHVGRNLRLAGKRILD